LVQIVINEAYLLINILTGSQYSDME